MRSLLPWVGALAVAYALLCAWAFFAQHRLTYYPTPERTHPWARPLWFDVEGARLKAWSVDRPGTRALLYFGGNAEDVTGSLDTLAAAVPDRTIVLVHYRGYGGSSGRPAERSLASDATAVFDQVRSRRPEVAVMGRSLGSAVAVQLASTRPVERLVLVTPFDSLLEVARRHFRWLPVRWLMRERYDAVQAAPRVTAPVLIVVAGADTIVPRARSDALGAAFAPGQATTVAVPGAGHNTLDASPDYLRSVAAFLAGPVDD